MLNRRRFLAASVLGSVAATLPVGAFVPIPLRAKPRFRRIHARREEGRAWLLYSDGPWSAPIEWSGLNVSA